MTVDDATSRAFVADALGAWGDRGWLRPLDTALAAFTADVCPTADGTVLLAAALAAHLEGQGHACLVVPALLRDPADLLGWDADAVDALRHVLDRLPPDVAGWRAAFARCDAVQFDDAASDGGGADDAASDGGVADVPVSGGSTADDAFVAGGAARAGAANDEGFDTDRGTPFVVDGERFYLRRYWRYERRIATAVAVRAPVTLPLDAHGVRSATERVFDQRTVGDDVDWQRVAAALALRGSLTIVTGGPGTGKTWTAARFIALAVATAPDPAALRIALAAPTGKAAARLRQSIDHALDAIAAKTGAAMPRAPLGAAKTLHALLGTRRGSRRFRHDAAHPLAFDVVVVDEASMVDVEMMAALVDALAPTTRLLLLGDKDQLSSVEAGAVLGELCGRGEDPVGRADGAFADGDAFDPDTAAWLEAATGDAVSSDPRAPVAPAPRVVALRRSERFGGAIGALARAVNDGRAADARAQLMDGGDPAVAWSGAADRDAVVAFALDGFADYRAALAERSDSLFAEDHEAWVRRVLAAFERFRLLCAVRHGDWGVIALNRAIEDHLAGGATGDAAGAWYEGRPVLVARNDYDVGVFNGDIGVVLRASPSDARLRVWFADGPSDLRAVAPTRLASVETAFAMTVHKSQGSEFTHTALVLPPAGSRVVTRELLYTAITRARERFTLIAPSHQSLDDAVARRTRRSSGIAAMLARGR